MGFKGGPLAVVVLGLIGAAYGYYSGRHDWQQTWETGLAGHVIGFAIMGVAVGLVLWFVDSRRRRKARVQKPAETGDRAPE